MHPIASRRLLSQRLHRAPPATPSELLSWMGAMQAQDYAASLWSVGLRLQAGATRTSVEAALANGTIIRTHAMRGTWQLLAAEDVRWILDLVGPRLRAQMNRRLRELKLDARTLRRSGAALEKALQSGRSLTRSELAAELEKAGIAPTGPRLSHLLGYAELEGRICSGASRGTQRTYALLDERIPLTPPLPRDEALATLATRYFQSRGPATVSDFVWWSGLPTSEARAALESIRSHLHGEPLSDGHTHWRLDTAARPPNRSGLQLLPAFDEYLVAYRDRTAVLDPRHVQQVNPGGGLLSPAIVLDGRVIGTWKLTVTAKTATLSLRPFDSLPIPRKSLLSALGRYSHFLERKVALP